jgi:hypothetical protein
MASDPLRIGAVLDGFLDQVGDVEHLVLLHAAGGDGGRAEADAAGLEGALRVEGNRVLVHRDAGLVEHFRNFLAGDVLRLEIDEHEMVIGRAGDDAENRFSSSLRRAPWRCGRPAAGRP